MVIFTTWPVDVLVSPHLRRSFHFCGSMMVRSALEHRSKLHIFNWSPAKHIIFWQNFRRSHKIHVENDWQSAMFRGFPLDHLVFFWGSTWTCGAGHDGETFLGISWLFITCETIRSARITFFWYMFRYRFFVQMLLSHAEPVKIPPNKKRCDSPCRARFSSCVWPRWGWNWAGRGMRSGCQFSGDFYEIVAEWTTSCRI